MSTLEARIDRLESESALRRLAAEYCHGADKWNLERFLGVWTDDAVWVLSDVVSYVGRDAIARVVERQWEAFVRYSHWTTNHVVEVVGDHATGECDVDVTVLLHSGRWVRGGATYVDEYRRVDGRWLISRRDVRHRFDIDAPPTDEEMPVKFGDLSDLPTEA